LTYLTNFIRISDMYGTPAAILVACRHIDLLRHASALCPRG
jgi:hypothetical protein